MKQYDRSVIIFDIDSIAGVAKEYSSIKKDVAQAVYCTVEGASLYFQELESRIMEVVLNIGKNLKEQDNLWVFYITREKMMTLKTKNDLNFPLTQSEIKFQELQAEQDI